MALEEVTNFGATGYTQWHSHAGTTTVNVDSRLFKRNGPGTGYAQIGQYNPGDWWNVAEKVNGWCREPGWDAWASGDFMSNPNPHNPTPRRI